MVQSDARKTVLQKTPNPTKQPPRSMNSLLQGNGHRVVRLGVVADVAVVLAMLEAPAAVGLVVDDPPDAEGVDVAVGADTGAGPLALLLVVLLLQVVLEAALGLVRPVVARELVLLVGPIAARLASSRGEPADRVLVDDAGGGCGRRRRAVPALVAPVDWSAG